MEVQEECIGVHKEFVWKDLYTFDTSFWYLFKQLLFISCTSVFFFILQSLTSVNWLMFQGLNYIFHNDMLCTVNIIFFKYFYIYLD